MPRLRQTLVGCQWLPSHELFLQRYFSGQVPAASQECVLARNQRMATAIFWLCGFAIWCLWVGSVGHNTILQTWESYDNSSFNTFYKILNFTLSNTCEGRISKIFTNSSNPVYEAVMYWWVLIIFDHVSEKSAHFQR